ncbi:hypothetical protein CYMTET_43666 [Cymbomonas tetramitiformis]|uniref:Schlafen AlbA-2 domain-containing protein n=1 Tax=Cymbomonas tetramitiformis TaxID=36881 RepID=A0AAE0C2U0_9CHLO|nr:hypothetical protein CYMTET_43666 [Cymbomonas tetramitiformis]
MSFARRPSRSSGRVSQTAPYVYGQILPAGPEIWKEIAWSEGEKSLNEILSTFSRYALAFLNANGGKVLYGVLPSGQVAGVCLHNRSGTVLTDKLVFKVADLTAHIKPAVEKGLVTLKIQPISGCNRYIACLIIKSPPILRSYYSSQGGLHTYVWEKEQLMRLEGSALMHFFKEAPQLTNHRRSGPAARGGSMTSPDSEAAGVGPKSRRTSTEAGVPRQIPFGSTPGGASANSSVPGSPRTPAHRNGSISSNHTASEASEAESARGTSNTTMQAAMHVAPDASPALKHLPTGAGISLTGVGATPGTPPTGIPSLFHSLRAALRGTGETPTGMPRPRPKDPPPTPDTGVSPSSGIPVTVRSMSPPTPAAGPNLRSSLVTPPAGEDVERCRTTATSIPLPPSLRTPRGGELPSPRTLGGAAQAQHPTEDSPPPLGATTATSTPSSRTLGAGGVGWAGAESNADAAERRRWAWQEDHAGRAGAGTAQRDHALPIVQPGGVQSPRPEAPSHSVLVVELAALEAAKHDLRTRSLELDREKSQQAAGWAALEEASGRNKTWQKQLQEEAAAMAASAPSVAQVETSIAVAARRAERLESGDEIEERAALATLSAELQEAKRAHQADVAALESLSAELREAKQAHEADVAALEVERKQLGAQTAEVRRQTAELEVTRRGHKDDEDMLVQQLERYERCVEELNVKTKKQLAERQELEAQRREFAREVKDLDENMHQRTAEARELASLKETTETLKAEHAESVRLLREEKKGHATAAAALAVALDAQQHYEMQRVQASDSCDTALVVRSAPLPLCAAASCDTALVRSFPAVRRGVRLI